MGLLNLLSTRLLRPVFREKDFVYNVNYAIGGVDISFNYVRFVDEHLPVLQLEFHLFIGNCFNLARLYVLAFNFSGNYMICQDFYQFVFVLRLQKTFNCSFRQLREGLVRWCKYRKWAFPL